MDLPQCLEIQLANRNHGNLFMHIWSLQGFREELVRGSGLGNFIADALTSFVFFRQLPDWVEITSLATDPWFQGRGHMRALIQELKAILPAGRPMKLEVHHLNQSALGLYKEVGFIVEGERKNYYGPGGHALLMGLSL